jgi:1-pyrroline-5-carboxylate dehydrogenase
VSLVVEQLLRLLHHCGAPPEDVDLLHGDGRVVNRVITDAQPRSVLFTGGWAGGRAAPRGGGRGACSDAAAQLGGCRTGCLNPEAPVPAPSRAGSQRVAEKLAGDTQGKIFLEDAGFDWKVGGWWRAGGAGGCMPGGVGGCVGVGGWVVGVGGWGGWGGWGAAMPTMHLHWH